MPSPVPSNLFGHYLLAGHNGTAYWCRGRTRVVSIPDPHGESLLSFALRSKLRDSKAYVLMTDADLAELVEAERAVGRLVAEADVGSWFKET